MNRLTKKKYWNSIYDQAGLQPEQPATKAGLKSLIKTLFGEKAIEFMSSYADYRLWEVIYKNYLPKTEGAKVLEVGSAPGDYLVKLSEKFGFVPYGVEYSEAGAELNRKLFISHNIDPENVIQADFLTDEFHKQYKGHFDMVISRGFIEHFTDLEDIIEKHLNLLAVGGQLIVSVPNLRGVNYFLARFFCKEDIPLHNLKIMRKKEFLKLFDKASLSGLFSSYYGTFDFNVFNTEDNFSKRFALFLCQKMQLGLNVIFRLLFREKGAESELFSPYLIFIGVKKEARRQI